MTNKMHAAVVEQFGKPMVLQECNIPTPGPGQILIRMDTKAYQQSDKSRRATSVKVSGLS